MICRSLEQAIGEQEIRLGNFRHIGRGDPTFIPIHLTGGIGDVILSRVALFELAKRHQLSIFTSHSEAFNYFGGEIKAIQGPMPFFTWHLELNTIARFRFADGFEGFTLPNHRGLFQSQRNAFERDPRLEAMVQDHPLYDLSIARSSQATGHTRWTYPLFSLGLPRGTSAPKVRRRASAQLITVHDGFDLASEGQVGERSTKQWELGHWRELVRRLGEAFPEYRIVQLGGKTGRRIEGTDCLLNLTTLTETFDLLSASALHVDGDSGLVHAATEMGVPCVVMFGPTPDYFFGHPENTNLRTRVCADACYWLSPDWLARCPIGFPGPKCLDELSPDQVFEAARTKLLASV